MPGLKQPVLSPATASKSRPVTPSVPSKSRPVTASVSTKSPLAPSSAAPATISATAATPAAAAAVSAAVASAAADAASSAGPQQPGARQADSVCLTAEEEADEDLSMPVSDKMCCVLKYAVVYVAVAHDETVCNQFLCRLCALCPQ